MDINYPIKSAQWHNNKDFYMPIATPNAYTQFQNAFGDELMRMHKGDGVAILNAVTGTPIEMSDHAGNTAAVSSFGSLSVNNPRGDGINIGPAGVGTTFSPAEKTQVTLNVNNPIDPGGHIGFIHGGPDEITPFEGIQGLPEEESYNNKNSAENFLDSYLTKFKKENPRYNLDVNF